jgi:hypothetical protein
VLRRPRSFLPIRLSKSEFRTIHGLQKFHQHDPTKNYYLAWAEKKGACKRQSKRLGAKHYRVEKSRTVSGTPPQENNCATNRNKDAVEACYGFGNCTHAMSAKTMLSQNFWTKTLSSYDSATWNVGSTISCTLILILPVIDAGGRQPAIPAIKVMCR